MAGTLFRKSAVLGVWKERHVVVGKDSLMYWYTSESDTVPEDVIYLKKATGVRREEVAGRGNTFIVTFKNVEKILGFANPLAPKVTIFPFSATKPEQMEVTVPTHSPAASIPVLLRIAHPKVTNVAPPSSFPSSAPGMAKGHREGNSKVIFCLALSKS